MTIDQGEPTDVELTAATDRMAAAAHAFMARAYVGETDVSNAYCGAMEAMRHRGWPPERALAHCKRVTAVQALAVGITRDEERRAWIGEQMVRWLLACYFQ